jgi:hypothetical protein
MAASVSLIKALGGGWTIAHLPMVEKGNQAQSASGQ